MCAVVEELYYVANNQKIAEKKKADYQEGLEKGSADSAARSRNGYMKDLEKVVHKSASHMKDPKKNRVDSAAQSGESYKKDLENSH